MAKVLVKRYLHSDKENNWDLVDKFGHDDLKWSCHEVEILLQIDTETGQAEIIGCNGFFLDEQDYENEEITKV